MQLDLTILNSSVNVGIIIMILGVISFALIYFYEKSQRSKLKGFIYGALTSIVMIWVGYSLYINGW